MINFNNSECHAVKLQHDEDGFRAFQKPLMRDSLVMLVGLPVADRDGYRPKRQETGGKETEDRNREREQGARNREREQERENRK